MATESIRVSGIIPATPKQIYDAWLSSEGHTAFTGSKAIVDGRVGGKFTARAGYIRGETLELEPGKRIVQAWRSTDFPKGAAASRLEVSLTSRKNMGTEITFLHSGIPEGQGHQYEAGWLDAYLTKMRRYFGNLALKKAEAKANPAKAEAKNEAKKAAPKKVAKSLRSQAEKSGKPDAPRPKARPKRPAQATSTRGKAKPATKRAPSGAKKAKAKAKPVARRVAKKSRPR